jgi:hypothetical protein
MWITVYLTQQLLRQMAVSMSMRACIQAEYPECDGAIWVGNDSLGSVEGCSFAFLSRSISFELFDMFDKCSTASSVSFLLLTYPARSFILLFVSLGANECELCQVVVDFWNLLSVMRDI